MTIRAMDIGEQERTRHIELPAREAPAVRPARQPMPTHEPAPATTPAPAPKKVPAKDGRVTMGVIR